MDDQDPEVREDKTLMQEVIGTEVVIEEETKETLIETEITVEMIDKSKSFGLIKTM